MATVALPFWSNRPVCHNNNNNNNTNNNNYVKVRPAGVWPPSSGGSVRVSQVEPPAEPTLALGGGGGGPSMAMAGTLTDLGDVMPPPPVATSNAQVLVANEAPLLAQDRPLYNSGTKSPSLLCVVLDD